MTNILVTAMLLTGGSAVASSLCGVPTAAACFLLPIGVVRKLVPDSHSLFFGPFFRNLNTSFIFLCPFLPKEFPEELCTLLASKCHRLGEVRGVVGAT